MSEQWSTAPWSEIVAYIDWLRTSLCRVCKADICSAHQPAKGWLDALVRQGLLQVGICGDRAADIFPNGPKSVCDLPAGHAGWHGAPNPPDTTSIPSRMSWAGRNEPLVLTLLDDAPHRPKRRRAASRKELTMAERYANPDRLAELDQPDCTEQIDRGLGYVWTVNRRTSRSRTWPSGCGTNSPTAVGGSGATSIPSRCGQCSSSCPSTP